MSNEPTSEAKIVIYGAEWCPPCHLTKNYLHSINVEYEYRNVDDNRDWLEESVKISGQTGIPVIDIQGDIIVGFDRPTIDNSLRKHALV